MRNVLKKEKVAVLPRRKLIFNAIWILFVIIIVIIVGYLFVKPIAIDFLNTLNSLL